MFCLHSLQFCVLGISLHSTPIYTFPSPWCIHVRPHSSVMLALGQTSAVTMGLSMYALSRPKHDLSTLGSMCGKENEWPQ